MFNLKKGDESTKKFESKKIPIKNFAVDFQTPSDTFDPFSVSQKNEQTIHLDSKKVEEFAGNGAKLLSNKQQDFSKILKNESIAPEKAHVDFFQVDPKNSSFREDDKNEHPKTIEDENEFPLGIANQVDFSDVRPNENDQFDNSEPFIFPDGQNEQKENYSTSENPNLENGENEMEWNYKPMLIAQFDKTSSWHEKEAEFDPFEPQFASAVEKNSEKPKINLNDGFLHEEREKFGQNLDEKQQTDFYFESNFKTVNNFEDGNFGLILSQNNKHSAFKLSDVLSDRSKAQTTNEEQFYEEKPMEFNPQYVKQNEYDNIFSKSVLTKVSQNTKTIQNNKQNFINEADSIEQTIGAKIENAEHPIHPPLKTIYIPPAKVQTQTIAKKNPFANKIKPLISQNSTAIEIRENGNEQKTGKNNNSEFTESPRLKNVEDLSANLTKNWQINETKISKEVFTKIESNTQNEIQKTGLEENEYYKSQLARKMTPFYWSESGLVYFNTSGKQRFIQVQMEQNDLFDKIGNGELVCAEDIQILFSIIKSAAETQFYSKVAEFNSRKLNFFTCKDSGMNFLILLLNDLIQKKLDEEEFDLISGFHKNENDNPSNTIIANLLEFVAQLSPSSIFDSRDFLHDQFKAFLQHSKKLSFLNYLKFCIKVELFENISKLYQNEELAFLVCLKVVLENKSEFSNLTLNKLTHFYSESQENQFLCCLICPDILLTKQGLAIAICNSRNMAMFKIYDFLFSLVQPINRQIYNSFYCVFLLATLPLILSTYKLKSIRQCVQKITEMSSEVNPEFLKNPFFNSFVRYYKEILIKIISCNSKEFMTPKETLGKGLFVFVNSFLNTSSSKIAPKEESSEKIVYDPKLKRYIVNGKILEEHKDALEVKETVKTDFALPPKNCFVKEIQKQQFEEKVETGKIRLAEFEHKSETNINENTLQDLLSSPKVVMTNIGLSNANLSTSSLARKNQLNKNRFVSFASNKN